MSDVLASLKKDLLGQRLLPVFVLLALALAAAVAYAVLGAGGSASTTPAASLPAKGVAGVAPIANPAPANPNHAVAEITSGAHYQRGGPAHNPFKPLPEPPKPVAKTITSSSAAASPGGAKTSSGTSGGGSAPSTPQQPTPPAKPKPPKVTYQVALLLGQAPLPGQNPQLTPYENLTRLTPLPSKQNELLVYSGVGPTGKGAIFTLLQPAILKGKATCKPSAQQCEQIDVPVGQTEELSYIGETGQPYTYLLQVVSIVRSEASARVARARVSSARTAGAQASRTAREQASNTLGGHGAPLDNSRRVARPRAHVHR